MSLSGDQSVKSSWRPPGRAAHHDEHGRDRGRHTVLRRGLWQRRHLRRDLWYHRQRPRPALGGGFERKTICLRPMICRGGLYAARNFPANGCPPYTRGPHICGPYNSIQNKKRVLSLPERTRCICANVAYSAWIAPVGQTPAQAPQSTQEAASTTALSSMVIAPTGQVSTQAPQATHSLETV